MTQPVDVRRGTAADTAFVYELGRRIAATSAPAGRDVSLDAVRLGFERLVGYVFSQSYLLLIAHDAERPLGFLLLLDSMPDEVTLAPQAFVAYMAVEPGAQRRGIGRALFGAAEDEARARGLPAIALMVTESNLAARGLYDAVGLSTERRLMSKTL